jgi:hypothetical protein
MTNSKIIKAVRAPITLGDTELDVYQLPDSSYGYEYIWLAELIQRDKQILSNKKSPYYLKGIVGEALANQTIKIDGISASDNKKKYLTQDQLMAVLAAFSKLGHDNCLAILLACAIEALERRADAAFNVLRTEEERNQRFIIRRDGILSRHFWTDTVDWWVKNHPEQVSDNYRRFVYSNVSDCLNRTLFGKTARQLLEHYDLPKDASPRDYFPSETLRLVDSIEKAVGVRVRKTGAEPKQALKEMLAFMGIEPDESLL